LRNNATDVERRMWRILSVHRPRFTRQHVVGPYILDLACRGAKLAVEFDGGHHWETLQYDGERTRFLEALGWKVIRFWNSEVTDNPEGVAQTIILAAAKRVSE
jgi:very-short-patch-repair endonuclease